MSVTEKLLLSLDLSKMAAREILSDVLNNFLPSDSLLEWLSNDTPIKHVGNSYA